MHISLYVTDVRSLYDARFYAALVNWVAEWGEMRISPEQARVLSLPLHCVDYPHPNWKEADFVRIDIEHWSEIAEKPANHPTHWIVTKPLTWERIHLVQLRKATGWHYLLLSLPDEVDRAVQIIRSVQPQGVVFRGFEESDEGLQYMHRVERILEQI